MPPKSKHGTVSVSESRGTKSAPLAVTINDTATLIAPLDPNRISIRMVNDSAFLIYVGSDPTVTVENGVPLAADGGELHDWNSYDAWYGVTTLGNQANYLKVIVTTVAGT